MLAEGESLGLAYTPTDVVLKIGDSKLLAHKTVLQRSPVFKAMLESDMAEANTGSIKLEGISVAAATALLEFFYGRKFSLLDAVDLTIELLNASVMYELPELREICEDALQESVIVTNVGPILEAACIYESACLKAVAIEFLNRNKKLVTATYKWKTVIKRNPILILDAMLEA